MSSLDSKPLTHTPVLLNEVLTLLNPQPGKLYVDCTLGGGGHSKALWQLVQPKGRIVGVDQDLQILTQTRSTLSEETIPIETLHGRFDALPQLLASIGITTITGGVLADLGVSSFQLDEGSRGFSFNKAAPLDMRMDTTQEQTAADIVNTASEDRLVQIFSDYGEERFSKTIARAIVAQRKTQAFEITTDLSSLITAIYQKMPGGPKGKFRIHPATRVFQALRIEVNRELLALEGLLNGLPSLLVPGAVVAVISFHSLEDRIVKRAFRQWVKSPENTESPRFQLLTKKPLEATDAEIQLNPRARSAKLRGVIRLSD